jgi:hypothetical protein
VRRQAGRKKGKKRGAKKGRKEGRKERKKRVDEREKRHLVWQSRRVSKCGRGAIVLV